jgi:hypothetical protein
MSNEHIKQHIPSVEWIELQNKQWTEEDGTNHHISKLEPLLSRITYSIYITIPITNKKFYYTVHFKPIELTNSAIKNFSITGKEKLLELMYNELTNIKPTL